MKEEHLSYGQIIKQRRRELGMLQKELAAKLGVRASIVSRWETDLRVPGQHVRARLERLLGLEMPEQVQREAKPPGQPSLGTELRARRRAQQLTRKQVGQRIGVDEAVVAQWERDELHPGTTQLFALERVLGLDLAVACPDLHGSLALEGEVSSASQETGAPGLSFGQRLSQRRQELGLSRKALAQALGISVAALGLWERDTQHPKLPNLKKLEQLLATSLADDDMGNAQLEGMALKRWRLGQGLTLRQLEELTGISRQTLLRWESPKASRTQKSALHLRALERVVSEREQIKGLNLLNFVQDERLNQSAQAALTALTALERSAKAHPHLLEILALHELGSSCALDGVSIEPEHWLLSHAIDAQGHRTALRAQPWTQAVAYVWARYEQLQTLIKPRRSNAQGAALIAQLEREHELVCFEHAEATAPLKSKLAQLFRAGLLYGQLESLAGLGVGARLMLTALLNRLGLLGSPVLGLSAYLGRHRQQFGLAMHLISDEADWTAWLMFFFDALKGAALESHQLLTRLSAQLEHDQARLFEHSADPRPSALLVKLSAWPLLCGQPEPQTLQALLALKLLEPIEQESAPASPKLWRYKALAELLEPRSSPSALSPTTKLDDLALMIRRARKLKGLSQAQLGAKLNISTTAISSWERALLKPRPDMLFKLEEVLGLPSVGLLKLAAPALASPLSLGAVIERKRAHLGLTQDELAKAVGLKSYRRVMAWEHDRLEPKPEELLRLERVLGQLGPLNEASGVDTQAEVEEASKPFTPAEGESKGALIREHRLRLAMSQEQLGKFLGVALNTISHWETDKNRPQQELALKLEQFFGLEPYTLAQPPAVVQEVLEACLPTTIEHTPQGDRIRQARMRLGLSQSQLAKRLGITRSAISQWESDKVLPRDDLARGLELELGLGAYSIPSGTSPAYRPAQGQGEGVSELEPHEFKQWRLAQGLTRVKVQALTGLSPSQLARWEAGEVKYQQQATKLKLLALMKAVTQTAARPSGA